MRGKTECVWRFRVHRETGDLEYVVRLSVREETVVRGETECTWRSRVHKETECMSRSRVRGQLSVRGETMVCGETSRAWLVS